MNPRRCGAGALALAMGACAAGGDYAESRRVLVDVGMSQDEVRRAIGEPVRRVPIAPTPGIEAQTVEVWQYRFEPTSDIGTVLEVVVTAGALVLIVAAAAAGGGTGLGGVKGGGGDADYRFWVGFGPDGRVRGVTNLERVP
jgi:hypothetical protein